MIQANYHTHTHRCNHAVGEDREYVESAIRAGMKVIGFADHCPWDFGGGYVSPIRMLPDEIDDYFNSLLSLRKEYADDITLYIGFEAEYIPELIEKQQKLLEGYPLDYMIIGQHYNQPEQYAHYTGFPTSDKQLLSRYIDLIIEGLSTGNYKYAAHPDLINFTGGMAFYDEQFRRLCNYLSANDIPAEINVLGVAGGRHYTSEHFLEIASECGCSAILGCDAHTPDSLLPGKYTEKCIRLAEKYKLPLVKYLPGLEPKNN